MLSSFGALIFQGEGKVFLFKQPLHVRVEMGSDLQGFVFYTARLRLQMGTSRFSHFNLYIPPL